MKHNWTRFLFTATCLILLVGLIGIPIVAEAEETIALEKDENGYYVITCFDDLKELTSHAFTFFTGCRYTTTDSLIIEESITIPEYLHLYAPSSQIQIPETVTLTIDGSLASASMSIEGNCVCNGNMVPGSPLKISGTLTLAGELTMGRRFSNSTFTDGIEGRENILYTDSGSLHWQYYVEEDAMEYLKTIISEASLSKNGQFKHYITLGQLNSDLYITESICIPSNCFLANEAVSFGNEPEHVLTIEDGCILTLECDSEFFGPVEVKGSLVNKGDSMVAKPMNVSGSLINEGTISFRDTVTINGELQNNMNLVIYYDLSGNVVLSENGQYSGKGTITVSGSKLTDPYEALTCIDDTVLEIKEYNEMLAYWLLGSVYEPDSEPSAVRVYGANRFTTAFLVADKMKENLGINKFNSIIVASATEFADALSGSYLAAVKNVPILLVSNSEEINETVKFAIKANLNPGGTVYILGGEKAVPESFKDGLEEQFTVNRLAGGNRFETNLLVLQEAGVGDKPILVCTGLTFADSLSASATKLPILLVYGNKLLPEQAAFMESVKGRELYIIGGEGAVSKNMETALTAYGTVERVAGGNRFETSVMIAEKFFAAPESAVLAYAWGFPDGLCGGPLAAAMNAPLILTMDKYESKAAEYIQSKGIASGTILGGEKLIPESSINKIFP